MKYGGSIAGAMHNSDNIRPAFKREITCGRIGGKGRKIVTLAQNEEQALLYIQKVIKRRESATKRIGVGYKVKN